MSRARRLFFALWPDDAVRHALLHWQTHNLPGSVRWQHRADLHMTLRFLGMVDPDRIDDLRRIGDDLPHESFGLVLDETGYWARPQVLWCGPSSPPGGLLSLHQALEGALAAEGWPVEQRPFRPHVTLARKVRQAGAYGPLLPVSWQVRELALVESRAGQVPLYQPLHVWSLT